MSQCGAEVQVRGCGSSALGGGTAVHPADWAAGPVGDQVGGRAATQMGDQVAARVGVWGRGTSQEAWGWGISSKGAGIRGQVMGEQGAGVMMPSLTCGWGQI